MVIEDVVLDYPEAWRLVAAHAAKLTKLPTETVAIQLAAGRCLAADIHADRDQPPFHRSTRDGFAMRAADAQLESLKVIGQLRAGEPPFAGTVQPGEAVEIMTGAPMPSGADAVLMVEHVGVTHMGPPGISAVSINPKAGPLPAARRKRGAGRRRSKGRRHPRRKRYPPDGHAHRGRSVCWRHRS